MTTIQIPVGFAVDKKEFTPGEFLLCYMNYLKKSFKQIERIEDAVFADMMKEADTWDYIDAEQFHTLLTWHHHLWKSKYSKLRI